MSNIKGTPDKKIDKTGANQKVWLEVTTLNILPGEQVKIKLTEKTKKELQPNVEFVEVSATIDKSGKALLFVESSENKDAEVDNTEYIYYESDGNYLGGDESSQKVILTTKTKYDNAKKNKKWSSINITILKLFDTNITHTDFLKFAGIVNGEATHYNAKDTGISHDELKKERYAFGNVVVNYMKSKNIKKISSIPKGFTYAKDDETAAYKELTNSKSEDRSNEWIKASIYAIINAISGGKDYSNGALQWDGGDVFTGNYSKVKKSSYNPMKHYRQRAYPYDARIKGIYDKDNLSKKMYYNLKKYYSKIDTHRLPHLKPLYVRKTKSNWDMLFFEEKSYEKYSKGEIEFGEIKFVDEDKKPPKYDINTVPMVSSGSTRTWMFAGLLCLWEVKAQYACTIFYKQLYKKYDKSLIDGKEAPFI